MLQSRKEVAHAIKTCFNNIEKLKVDKLGQFFSFLVRSGATDPMSEKDIRTICEHFKKGASLNQPALMTCVAIFTKASAKHVLFNS